MNETQVERERCAKVCDEFARQCREEAQRRSTQNLHSDAKEFGERAVAAEALAEMIREGR